MTVTMTTPGTITSASFSSESIMVSSEIDFTLTFTPVNYVQNMELVVTVPNEITLPTFGLYSCTRGTDQENCYYSEA